MLDDEKVIDLVLTGDIEQYRLLVERYQQPVMRIANGITGNHHLSEEIAQEVFLIAFRKLDDFDSAISQFSTWLFTIARNRSINVLRKKSPATGQDLPERTSNNGPGAGLEERELFAELDRALARLPEEQKIVFVLAELEGLSYREIAGIEGVTIGTIKSRLNRARAKLSAALKSRLEMT